MCRIIKDMTTTSAVTQTPANLRDAERRTELAAFLRSRRERLTPEELGLATFGRRRHR